MNREKTLKLLIILLVVFVIYDQTKIDKVDISNIRSPIQNNIKEVETITHVGDGEVVEIKLLAEYSIDAVVKGKKKYTSDRTSTVSKYDLALVWGDMASQELDQFIEYSQTSRWYYYKYSYDIPVDGSYIAENSANTHIIHADEYILEEIERIKEEDRVLLEGYLVEVDFNFGKWRSSLTRKDTGDKACEIMYVTDVKILEDI